MSLLNGFKMRSLAVSGLLIIVLLIYSPFAKADPLEATVHSWIREFNTGESFLIGVPFIQKQTTFEDRVVMEFNLSDLTPVEHAYLNFYIFNGDRTNNFLPGADNFITLSAFSFEGDGLESTGNFYRTDSFVSHFSDFGIISPECPTTGYNCNLVPISLDITTVLNAALSNGSPFLGFVLLADSTFSCDLSFSPALCTGARYSMPLFDDQSINAFTAGQVPQISDTTRSFYSTQIPVPEPSAFVAVATGLLVIIVFLTISPSQREDYIKKAQRRI